MQQQVARMFINKVKYVKSGLLESVSKLRSTTLYFFKAKILITNYEHLLRGQVDSAWVTKGVKSRLAQGAQFSGSVGMEGASFVM